MVHILCADIVGHEVVQRLIGSESLQLELSDSTWRAKKRHRCRRNGCNGRRVLVAAVSVYIQRWDGLLYWDAYKKTARFATVYIKIS